MHGLCNLRHEISSYQELPFNFHNCLVAQFSNTYAKVVILKKNSVIFMHLLFFQK